MVERKLHGVQLDIPEDWQEASVYRFRVPQDRAEQRLLASRPAQALDANVIVTTHDRDPRGLKAALLAANDGARAESKGFAVLASGTAEVSGISGLYQDSMRTHAGLTVFQRHIAVEDETGSTVLTFTGSRKDLDRISQALHIHLLSEQLEEPGSR